MRRFFALLSFVAAVALPAWAQDETAQEQEDKSVLENFLEENLSGAGRDVTVTGFSGALSRQATMAEMTFADEDGIWLRLAGVTLDWTRSAILARRLEINELVATEIELVRLPGSGGDGPSAQASDFTLPELPVSINIGRLAAERLILGEAVLGEAAELTLEGSGRLADGEGEAAIDLRRIDGVEGDFALDASYSNASRVLALGLQLSEGPEGIAAKIIGLPGEPALDLIVEGNDPLSDFTAAVVLRTDDEDRLAGEVHVAMETSGEGENATSETTFGADLSGDLRPLFESQYQDFFGVQSVIHVDGTRFSNGTLQLADLFLKTDAFELSGDATINGKGWPERAHVEGRVAAANGEPLLLPISGGQTRIQDAKLSFDYDAVRGQGWTGALEVNDLRREGDGVDRFSLAGAGTLVPGGGGDVVPSIDGKVTLSASGIALADAVLSDAVGDSINGSMTFAKGDGTPGEFSDIAISGVDYGLTGNLTLSTDIEKLNLVAGLELTLAAERLARFAAVSGVDLTGAANLNITGDVAVPGGPFDVTILGETRGLAVGNDIVDGLIAGQSQVSLAVDRDQERTRIRRFTLTSPGVGADISGELREGSSRVVARFDLPDASRLDPALSGAVVLDGTAVQSGQLWTVDAEADGPGGLNASIDATAQTTREGFGPVEARVAAAIDSIAPYSGLAGQTLTGGVTLTADVTADLRTQAATVVGAAQGQNLGFGLGDADRLFSGASAVEFDVARDANGTLIVNRLSVDTPEIDVNATGNSSGGTSTVNFDARLANTAILVPALPGAFTARGQAVLTGETYRLDVSGNGPGGMTVAVAGTVAGDARRANLSINGNAPLALVNSFIGPNTIVGPADFNLGLNGPLQVSSLTGTINVPRARISLPAQRIALEQTQVNVTLGNGRARVEAGARVSSGGRIEVAGPVSLSRGYEGDLTVRLQNVGLTDPALYDTAINGELTVSGPLAGGALIAGDLSTGTMEIRIPSSGFGVAGTVDGLRHVNEPADVRTTRARAGKLDQANAGGGMARPYRLNITVTAPNQVFIRGRGLDAELGGQLRLTGNTNNIIPQGGLNLIRGRLDLLGNRLDLTEASATLQGSFDPYVRVVALTNVDEVSIRVMLEGFATSPEVTFSSTPDLPEDEILARLVFGRALADISPLQALKLANGVATLSGRSGAGVMGRLRDGFALSDLDVSTNDNGSLAVSAGAYISDNIYTGVQVGADGTAEINLNLDVTQNLTARGSVTTEGDTSIGIYFERDY